MPAAVRNDQFPAWLPAGGCRGRHEDGRGGGRQRGAAHHAGGAWGWGEHGACAAGRLRLVAGAGGRGAPPAVCNVSPIDTPGLPHADHEPAGWLRRPRQHQGKPGPQGRQPSSSRCVSFLPSFPRSPSLPELSLNHGPAPYPPAIAPPPSAGAAGHQPARHTGPRAAAPRPRGPPHRVRAARPQGAHPHLQNPLPRHEPGARRQARAAAGSWGGWLHWELGAGAVPLPGAYLAPVGVRAACGACLHNDPCQPLPCPTLQV